MAITKEEVEHLAKLARIELLSNEVENFTYEIESILKYVGQIKEVSGDTEKANPKLRNVMREDVVTNNSGEYTEQILNNAPFREGNYLKVKKIL